MRDITYILLITLVFISFIFGLFQAARIDVYYHEKLHVEIYNITGYENTSIEYFDWGTSGVAIGYPTENSDEYTMKVMNELVHIIGYHNNVLIFNLWAIYKFSMVFIISVVFIHEKRKRHNFK